MTNLEQQLLFCSKYKINANELFLLIIILLAQEGDAPELVKYYFNNIAKSSVRDNLIKLQQAGIINKSYKIPNIGDKLDIHKIDFNKTIIKDYYKCSFTLGQDLFDNYPLSVVVNGSEYKLRRVSKKFNSLEDAFRSYGKAIHWNPSEHNRIINLIKEGISSGYQFTTLGDFIVDNDWKNLEAISKDGILNNSNLQLL